MKANIRKRAFSLLLALVMICSLLPTAALAAEFFTQQIMPVNGPTHAAPADGTLDISKGAIIITETGYSQGKLIYDKNNGYSVVGEENAKITETEWTDDEHALTITGSYTGSTESDTSNTILIMGGSPTITLNNVTIYQEHNSTIPRAPGLVLTSGSSAESPNTATLVLVGTNNLTGADQAPGVQINKDAVLTIQGDGTLNATGRNNAAGIGTPRYNPFAINPSTKKSDNSYRSGGSLVINLSLIHI